jgi:hypothetical protein
MDAMVGYLSSTKILRVTISLSLVLWIAGLGCIFGCESLAMAAADAASAAATHRNAELPTQTVVSGASCHKAADHSCCAKRNAPARQSKPAVRVGLSDLVVSSASVNEMADGMMRECPMALNATALGTKVRTAESATSLALEPINLPLFSAVQTPVTQVPSFLNNRGHTYLRCCVFLI